MTTCGSPPSRTSRRPTSSRRRRPRRAAAHLRPASSQSRLRSLGASAPARPSTMSSSRDRQSTTRYDTAPDPPWASGGVCAQRIPAFTLPHPSQSPFDTIALVKAGTSAQSSHPVPGLPSSQRRVDLLKTAAAAEDAECTFRPALTDLGHATCGRHNSPHLSRGDRSCGDRVTDLRSREEVELDEHCTFQPNVRRDMAIPPRSTRGPPARRPPAKGTISAQRSSSFGRRVAPPEGGAAGTAPVRRAASFGRARSGTAAREPLQRSRSFGRSGAASAGGGVGPSLTCHGHPKALPDWPGNTFGRRSTYARPADATSAERGSQLATRQDQPQPSTSGPADEAAGDGVVREELSVREANWRDASNARQEIAAMLSLQQAVPPDPPPAPVPSPLLPLESSGLPMLPDGAAQRETIDRSLAESGQGLGTEAGRWDGSAPSNGGSSHAGSRAPSHRPSQPPSRPASRPPSQMPSQNSSRQPSRPRSRRPSHLDAGAVPTEEESHGL